MEKNDLGGNIVEMEGHAEASSKSSVGAKASLKVDKEELEDLLRLSQLTYKKQIRAIKKILSSESWDDPIYDSENDRYVIKKDGQYFEIDKTG